MASRSLERRSEIRRGAHEFEGLKARATHADGKQWLGWDTNSEAVTTRIPSRVASFCTGFPQTLNGYPVLEPILIRQEQ
eukprot:3868948-Rhodomonas_salina.1